MRNGEFLFFVSILCLGGCTELPVRHIVESNCAVDLPASWLREEVLGIDTSLVRYRGEGLVCEIEFGLHPENEKSEIGKLQHEFEQTDSSQSDSLIISVGGRLGKIMSDSGDQNIHYIGLRYDTLLYIPTERGYVTVRVFYPSPSDRPAALRILRSVRIEDRPNQALEPTSTSVMIPAGAGLTPAVAVAHL
jgi:hypothetical protein